MTAHWDGVCVSSHWDGVSVIISLGWGDSYYLIGMECVFHLLEMGCLLSSH